MNRLPVPLHQVGQDAPPYVGGRVVAPTDRSPAGCRLYDIDAVARLELVRALRNLEG